MAEDDKELFESAFKDEVIEAPETVETPEPVQSERTRDEQGRFKAKEQEPAPEPEQPQKAEGIPPWRLKEEADARRAAEENLSRISREMDELRRQITSTQKPEPEKPAPEIWEDPNGFVQAALSPVQQALQQQAERFSMRMAVKEHGKDVVSAAYQALGTAMRAGDPSARAEFQRIKTSDDPYEDIVQWHKRSQTLQMVGDDPNAWLERQLEERLKDPTYQAQLLERIRGTAQQQPRPVTQLPPSLNKATRAGTHPEEDESDAGLLKSALRR